MLAPLSGSGRPLPFWQRIRAIPRQMMGGTPFAGDCLPDRAPLLAWGSARPTVPFPHPWNYQEPIRILESFFWDADQVQGPGRHNRYVELPGFAPVLVSRDPGIIRAILTATGDREGQFDRDTLPSTGIARATGEDTLLYGNGPFWKRQRKAAASPFGKTGLFQEEVFAEFAETFRHTVRQRLETLHAHLQRQQLQSLRLELEPEIKAIMLEMLVNCFFGANIDYDEIRGQYVPALERLIDHIVRDTVTNRLGLSLPLRARFNRRIAQAQADFAKFDELTDRVLEPRKQNTRFWQKFSRDIPNEALRSNIKVFLAGALEATTSYAAWAISHLARDQESREKVFREVERIDSYSPEQLEKATYLGFVLEETLRLTPSLYFLPRRATCRTKVETADGRTMEIPAGTHILLDVWHANRHPDHWGVEATGYPADAFHPQRWEELKTRGLKSKEMLHFGFGHGPRVCPGKHLGELEVALVVGAFVKLFEFRAPEADNPVKAGVSTKPADGTLLDLELRRMTPRPGN